MRDWFAHQWHWYPSNISIWFQQSFMWKKNRFCAYDNYNRKCHTHLQMGHFIISVGNMCGNQHSDMPSYSYCSSDPMLFVRYCQHDRSKQSLSNCNHLWVWRILSANNGENTSCQDCHVSCVYVAVALPGARVRTLR